MAKTFAFLSWLLVALSVYACSSEERLGRDQAPLVALAISGSGGAGGTGGATTIDGAGGATGASSGATAGSGGGAVCNAESCPNGCCGADKQCYPGDLNGQCGKGGRACAVCPPEKGACVAGACVACDAKSCPNGCCSPFCSTGDRDNQCGNGGAACADCSKIAGKRICAGNTCTQCNAQTCPDGCCDEEGFCQKSYDATCGKGGVACVNCLGRPGTSVCDANGTCAACGPTTCGGCCDADGICQPATGDHCGANGNACFVCKELDKHMCINGQCAACDNKNCPGSVGCCTGGDCYGLTDQYCGNGLAAANACVGCTYPQVCSFGVCQDHKAPDCGPHNCKGCCSEYWGCITNSTSYSRNHCGLGGAACQQCGDTEVCSNGKCSACNADTCPKGCCAQGGCNEGTGSTRCGTGGAACVSCLGTQTSVCDPTSRTCVKCDATTCPNGCCDKGGCRTGDDRFSCGKGGGACASCFDKKQVCNAARQCAACDATTCPNGCCSEDGECVAPPVNNLCGVGGVACKDCTDNDTAKNCDPKTGACFVCSASTCPNGCCENGICRISWDEECGRAGQACQDCTSKNMSCVKGICTLPTPPI